MNNMILAKRMKTLRLSKGFTQEEVADILGISRQAYARLEQGKRTISFIDIKKVSSFYGIDYKEITEFESQSDMSLVSLCRDENCSPNAKDAFEKIQEILGVFSAQEKLKYRMEE